MGRKEKKKTYHLSNDQVSELARLVTGQYLARQESFFVNQGYQGAINRFMEETEKSKSINRKEVDVEWESAIKTGKIYTKLAVKKEGPKAVPVGPEEKRDEVPSGDLPKEDK